MSITSQWTQPRFLDLTEQLLEGQSPETRPEHSEAQVKIAKPLDSSTSIDHSERGWTRLRIAAPSWGDVTQMNPTAAKRLHRIQTFEGDPGLGFEKPSTQAVEAVSLILRAIYAVSSTLQSPAISPDGDGEILVSWRQNTTYLTLHFSTGTEFEWVFKQRSPISGKADAKNPHTQRELVSILAYLFDPTAISEVARTSFSSAFNPATITGTTTYTQHK